MQKFKISLFDVVRDGDIGSVRHLLEDDYYVNEQDANGNTPLHLAAYHRDVEMVELLINYGANLYARNYDGRTFLDMHC